MDITTMLGQLISPDSLEGIGAASGASSEEVQNVLNVALPILMDGALGQASGDDTLAGFTGALADHAKDDVSDVRSFLDGVDTEDGSKIVDHLLSTQPQTVDDISQRAGVSSNKTLLILALAAPLLMSLLGKETNSQQQQNSGLGVSSILGSLFGGLLGGGSTSTAAAAPAASGLGGSLLSSLLGGGASTGTTSTSSLTGTTDLLGGSSSGSSGGGLLDLLTSLLK